ncbi:MAG: MFS transporter [Candidatus Bathyarchaeia archaeon]
MNINKLKNYKWVMVSFSFIIAFLLHLLLFATAPMATIIMKEMNLSYAGFGFIFSAAMISLIIFRLFLGFISDKIGYIKALKIALPFSGIVAVLRALSQTYIQLVISQFLLGIGLAVVLPCLPLLIKDWVSERVGLSTGVYISGFAVGNATALGFTSYLLELMSWKSVLLLYGCIAIVISGFWWILAKTSLKTTSNVKLKEFMKVFKSKKVWVLLFFMIASMGAYDTLATWMPKVLEMKCLNKAFSSFLSLGFFLAGPIIGFILDKIKNRKLLIAFLGLISFASIVTLLYAPLPILGVCLFLAGFTSISMLTISLTIPPKDEELSIYAGSVTGFTSSLGNIGPFAMPIIFGLLIDVTRSFQYSILAVALLAGVTFTLGAKVFT